MSSMRPACAHCYCADPALAAPPPPRIAHLRAHRWVHFCTPIDFRDATQAPRTRSTSPRRCCVDPSYAASSPPHIAGPISVPQSVFWPALAAHCIPACVLPHVACTRLPSTALALPTPVGSSPSRTHCCTDPAHAGPPRPVELISYLNENIPCVPPVRHPPGPFCLSQGSCVRDLLCNLQQGFLF
ncbi:hypothetical protein DFH08DRAFT_863091 [Mycena albidolilacea]|uniref:Uncharacterized protein n=1 Tax=Mycena albidolilacea TaxID=1033008 RepID=A0AAD7A586_9AGAR|nr:hypothetical protein DFH08DRAFT_863091 [Mycena albidolilacea]